MDVRYSANAEEFRKELRTWLDRSVPAAWRRPGFWLDIEDSSESVTMRRDWEHQRYLNGFAGVDWPTQFGGRGGDLEMKAVHDEEMARARAPVGPFYGLTYLGTNLLGPTLMRYADAEQKKRLLPEIISGQRIFAQGFSEPDAGSDLASLRTSARRDSDDLIVSGQKIWTTMARCADALFSLVRSDPGSTGRGGLTFLMIDLTLPGVTVRPIRQMSGSREFGEEFLDDVRVPIAGNVIGEVDLGWTVARYLLSVERNATPISHYFDFTRELEDVIAVAHHVGRNQRRAIEDPHIRTKIARCKADLELLRVRAYYTMSQLRAGKDIGAEASTTKLLWTRVRLAIADLGADVLGRVGQLSQDVGQRDMSHVRWRHLHVRGQRLAGGTAQIQRNIVAQQLIGLPRE